MTITILSENGRGRHLCQWAIAEGFQVNMVLPENNSYHEFPFGEFIRDENTDWAQDYIEKAKTQTLMQMTLSGTQALDANLTKALSTSWFDLDKVVQPMGFTLGHTAAKWWIRDWQMIDWQRQIEKLKRQGVNFDPVELQFYGITFDFRSNFRQKPLWQWGSFKINWDPGLYQDVMPAAFVWLKNQTEYLAYENFAFVRCVTKEKNNDVQTWEVFVKIPYSSQTENRRGNLTVIRQAWIKDFCERLKWAKVDIVHEPDGDFKTLPFYQWKTPAALSKFEKDPYFYDKGPHTFGAWNFKAQWQCEKNIFDVLTQKNSQRHSQRKKNPYDFQILEA